MIDCHHQQRRDHQAEQRAREYQGQGAVRRSSMSSDELQIGELQIDEITQIHRA